MFDHLQQSPAFPHPGTAQNQCVLCTVCNLFEGGDQRLHVLLRLQISQVEQEMLRQVVFFAHLFQHRSIRHRLKSAAYAQRYGAKSVCGTGEHSGHSSGCGFAGYYHKSGLMDTRRHYRPIV